MLEVNGTKYSSFQEVCRVLGLLKDDNEWMHLLTEAAFTNTSAKMRQLFIILLMFCEVSNPLELFELHYLSMCEDFPESQCELDRRSWVLLQLQKYLHAFEKSLVDFGFTLPTEMHSVNQDCNYRFDEERVRRTQLNQSEISRSVAQLNSEQRVFFDTVVGSLIPDSQCRCFFLDAPGGTGKTFTLNVLLATIRSNGNNAIAVATSGIAAALLDGGRTFHSKLKCPLKVDNDTHLSIPAQSDLADYIRSVKVIVWDEAPMANKQLLECLDRSLRDINCNNDPFGGKVVVLTGDFRQVLPVLKGGSRAQIVGAALKNSSLWCLFKTFQLTKNMRLRATNLYFGQWLLKVGNGEVEVDLEGRLRILPSLVLPTRPSMSKHDRAEVIADWAFGTDVSISFY